jgi:hypothetical protein
MSKRKFQSLQAAKASVVARAERAAQSAESKLPKFDSKTVRFRP